MKNTNTNTETLLEQSVEKMLQSKVDMDTSDIFFNFGAVNANAMDFSEIENNQQNYRQPGILLTVATTLIFANI